MFDEPYVSALRKKWEKRPQREWPLVARIALDDHREDDRSAIDACVARLHPDDRSTMVRQLRNQFLTTYGELLVAQILINAGLAPRYEPSLLTAFGQLTPDWYIGGYLPLLCDVFTAGLKKDRDADETALRELEDRLSEITAPYFISIEMPRASLLDAGGRKRLAAEVGRWLSKGPSVGARAVFDSLRVEVVAKEGEHVEVLTNEPIHIVETPTSVAENFEEKAKKYGALGLPVIVAAVKHYRSEIEWHDVEDLMLGTPAYVSRMTTSGKTVGRTQRLNDGVFEKRTSLSAAMFIAPHTLPEPVVRVWTNPFAAIPLQRDVLERLSKAKL